MEQQAHPNNSSLGKKEHQKINYHRRPSMQGVKTNATTLWIKNWAGQKVIQIHQYCRCHNQPGLFPIGSKKDPSDSGWGYKMQAIMKEKLGNFEQLYGFHIIKNKALFF